MAATGSLQWMVEVTVDAPLDRTWAAIDDLALIPQYHPAVRQVEFVSGVNRRAPGVEYKCIVPTGPRRGWCIEKVIDHVPLRSTTVAFTADSWGLSRRVHNFVTEISVHSSGAQQTRVLLRGFYTPRGWWNTILNALVIRRAMRRRANDTLRGLKRLMESKASPQQ